MMWSGMISKTQKGGSPLLLFGTDCHILQQREANTILGVIWITDVVGAGAGYISLLWKDRLSQHWQCKEWLWTLLRLFQCGRREPEVCFHVLLFQLASAGHFGLVTRIFELAFEELMSRPTLSRRERSSRHLLRPSEVKSSLGERTLKNKRTWDGRTRFIQPITLCLMENSWCPVLFRRTYSCATWERSSCFLWFVAT